MDADSGRKLYDVKRIVVFDDASEDDYSPNDSLELRLSHRNAFSVDSKNSYTQEIANKGLMVNMTGGGILYIPPNVPINIESKNSIFGIVDSIGYISTTSTIDILVRHSKPSNIMLLSDTDIYINNKVVKPEELKNFTKIIDYQELWDEYDALFTSGLEKPIISSNMLFSRADFSRSKREKIYACELCEFGNALYLESGNTLNVYDREMKLKEDLKLELTEDDVGWMIYQNLGNSIARESIFQAKKYFKRWQDHILYRDALKEAPAEEKRIAEMEQYFTPETFEGPGEEITTRKNHGARKKNNVHKKTRTPNFTDVFPYSKYY